jgi:hypothetical protein
MIGSRSRPSWIAAASRPPPPPRSSRWPATRRAKDYAVPAASLTAAWHARAGQLGFDAAARARLLGRTTPAAPSQEVLARAAAVLLGPDGLTAKAAVFDRRDALRAWCGQLPGGAPVHAVEQLADNLLDNPEVVPVDRLSRRETRPGAARPSPGTPPGTCSPSSSR